jgi:drug/metabolite transporter (DMT)-like permease
MGEFRRIFRKRNLKLHFLRAFFVLSAQYSFYYYLQRNSLLNATVLLSLGPLFIPIIEWGVLRKKVGKSSWIGVAISLIGAVLILQPDKGIFTITSCIGLLAGICQGASQVVFGISSKEERADESVLILFLICAIFSSIPFMFEGVTWSAFPNWTWGVILILCLTAASIGTQLFRAFAYQHSTPSRLASFFYLSVILSGFWDWAIFHHVPNLLSIAGALLVILGGVLKIWLHWIYHKKA